MDRSEAVQASDHFFLGQIAANVEQLLEARVRDKDDIQEALRGLHSRLDSTDERVSVLERAFAKGAGIVAAIAAIPTAVLVIGYIVKLQGG